MNRAIVKTGAALAVAAGLMGGIVAAPVAYADASVVEAQQVTQEQVKAMIDKIVAAQPNVTPESWIKSGADSSVTLAMLDINKINNAMFPVGPGGVEVPDVDNQGRPLPKPTPSKSLEEHLVALQNAYNALKPGENLTLFNDPVRDMSRGDKWDYAYGTSSLMQVFWVDPDSKGNAHPGSLNEPLTNAFNGVARFKSSAVAVVGGGAYIQLDLGKTSEIKNFRLWRNFDVKTGVAGPRYANTALVVSSDPEFATREVVYYSGASQNDVFNLGAAPSDAYYDETEGGKDLLEGKNPVTGRYVRLYLNGTVDKVGGNSRILEIAITGTGAGNQSQAYDTKDLEATIARVRALLRDHAGDYSAETVKALEETLAKAEDLLARIKAGTATENLGAVSDLNAAIDQAENNLVKAYTVTFDDKVEGTEDIAVEAVEGAAVTLPANPVHPKGYTFEGWFLDKDGKDAFDPAKHTSGDITVYAKWSTPATELKPADPVKPEVKPEEKPEAKPEVKPEQKPENGDKPAKGDKLPQTGDASMIAVAASALGSAAAFMAARRRK